MHMSEEVLELLQKCRKTVFLRKKTLFYQQKRTLEEFAVYRL